MDFSNLLLQKWLRRSWLKPLNPVLIGVEASLQKAHQALPDLNTEQSLRCGGQGRGKAAPIGRRTRYTRSLQARQARGPTALWDKTLVVTQLENLLSSSCRHAPPRPIPPWPLFSPPWQPRCFQMFTLG